MSTNFAASIRSCRSNPKLTKDAPAEHHFDLTTTRRKSCAATAPGIPAVIRRDLRALGIRDRIEGLTKAVAQYFGVRYFQDAQTGQEKLIHSLRTAVIGPDGKLIKLYRGNEWKPVDVASDLRTAIAAK